MKLFDLKKGRQIFQNFSDPPPPPAHATVLNIISPLFVVFMSYRVLLSCRL